MNKRGQLNFHIILSFAILIPSGYLFLHSFNSLYSACRNAESAAIYSVITGCMLLLSLMNFISVQLAE